MPMTLPVAVLDRKRVEKDMLQLIAEGKSAEALISYYKDGTKNPSANICRIGILAAREANAPIACILEIQKTAEGLPGYKLVEPDIIRDLALYYAQNGKLAKAWEVLHSIPFDRMTVDQRHRWDLAFAKLLLYKRKYRAGLKALEALAEKIPVMSDEQTKRDVHWWLFVAYVLNLAFRKAVQLAGKSINEGTDKEPDRVKAWDWALKPVVGGLFARLGIWWKLRL